jgi:hypothetical protein
VAGKFVPRPEQWLTLLSGENSAHIGEKPIFQAFLQTIPGIVVFLFLARVCYTLV